MKSACCAKGYHEICMLQKESATCRDRLRKNLGRCEHAEKNYCHGMRNFVHVRSINLLLQQTASPQRTLKVIIPSLYQFLMLFRLMKVSCCETSGEWRDIIRKLDDDFLMFWGALLIYKHTTINILHMIYP